MKIELFRPDGEFVTANSIADLIRENLNHFDARDIMPRSRARPEAQFRKRLKIGGKFSTSKAYCGITEIHRGHLKRWKGWTIDKSITDFKGPRATRAKPFRLHKNGNTWTGRSIPDFVKGHLPLFHKDDVVFKIKNGEKYPTCRASLGLTSINPASKARRKITAWKGWTRTL